MSFGMRPFRLGTLRSLQAATRRRPASRTFVQHRFASTHQDLPSLRTSLLENVRLKDVTAIHTAYPALVAQLKETGAPSTSKRTSPLNHPDILSLLEVLASSGGPSELQRITDILFDLQPVFGIAPNAEVHTAIIRGLIKTGNMQKVSNWMFNMPKKPGHVSPVLEQFHLVLDAFVDIEPAKSIRFFVKNMRAAGCPPSNDTYMYVLRAKWNELKDGKNRNLEMFSSILDDMKLENLPFDPNVEAFLHDSFESIDLIPEANAIRETYRACFKEQSTEIKQILQLNSLLSSTAHQHGFLAAVKKLKSILNGENPTPSSLRALLRYSLRKQHLDIIQQQFSLDPTVDHWSIIISNNVRAGKIEDALAIYEDSRAAGIQPDAGLVDRLMRALCSGSVPESIQHPLDVALSIFRNLQEAAPLRAPEQKVHYDQHTAGPDAGIYHTLLRGLASSPDPQKYFPIAKEILDDMEMRGVSTKDSYTASSIIVLLMKCAPTTLDALDVYYAFRSSLDEQGYTVVLNAFCNLRPNGSPTIPSLKDYFAIVTDMRRAGLEITPEVYTVLLKQLALVADELKRTDKDLWQNVRDSFVTTTRRTHDFLTLDAAVSPDAHLWNQLMDTYQRLNCFGEACRVWETMYLSGRFDHVSVSIILDACGYSNSWHIAKKITSQLFRDRFSFNLHNWKTWIECLCRLGRLNDALRVVCLEMGKNNVTVEPDVESLKILVKFAKRDGHFIAVSERLQRHVPSLWDMLPEDMRTPDDLKEESR